MLVDQVDETTVEGHHELIEVRRRQEQTRGRRAEARRSCIASAGRGGTVVQEFNVENCSKTFSISFSMVFFSRRQRTAKSSGVKKSATTPTAFRSEVNIRACSPTALSKLQHAGARSGRERLVRGMRKESPDIVIILEVKLLDPLGGRRGIGGAGYRGLAVSPRYPQRRRRRRAG